jgi:hypothetical protein
VHWPLGSGVGELGDSFHDPVPGRRSVIVASEGEFGSSISALLERLITYRLSISCAARQMSISEITSSKVDGRDR